MSDADRRSLLGAARRGLEPSPDDRARNARALAAKLGIAVGAGAAGATGASSAAAATKAASTAAAAGTSGAAGHAGGAVAAKVGLSAKALLALKIAGAFAVTTGIAAVAVEMRSPPSGAGQASVAATSVATTAASHRAEPASLHSEQVTDEGSTKTASPTRTLDGPAQETPAPPAPTMPSSVVPPVGPRSAPSSPPRSAGALPITSGSAEGRAARMGAASGAAPSTHPHPGSVEAHGERAHASAPTADASPVAPQAPAPQVTDEIALVRAMHAAIAEGANARAVALADEHTRRFPNGTLRLEVEGLRIVAQCQASPSAASRQLAGDFAVRHARAPIVDRVRAACGTE